MSRHHRLLPLVGVLSLLLAVTSWSAEQPRRVSPKKPQTTASVTPGKVPTPAVIAPATTGIATSAAAPLYKLDWYSVNGGGALDASSASYKMGLSVGQPVAGDAASATYRMGIGFWHGTGGCDCPLQGDVNGDLVLDVFDVIAVIGIAFSGEPDPHDAGCPATRGDVNFDNVTDVFDLIYLIASAFSGGPMPVNPCN